MSGFSFNLGKPLATSVFLARKLDANEGLLFTLGLKLDYAK
jgi:hypothetical protein